MAKNNLLVSVIIPTYNRKQYLEKTILSVLNQTYKNIEVLVIDDGSSDNYAKSVCEKFEKCFYYYKNNGGVSSARNYGVRKAKGSFIAFLDDDDIWVKEKLKIQINALINHNDIDCVHGPVEVIDECDNRKGIFYGASKEKTHKRSGYVFWNALGVWLVKASTPLIRKEVFKGNLFFDEDIEVGEDTDFYQRMFFKHKVLYIDKVLTQYRVYSESKSLSSQVEKYNGLEKKIFNNFVKMGIKNPIILNKVARKLLLSKIKNLNKSNNNIKLGFFEKYFLPIHTLKNIK
ncbi:glycosyltransferase [Polaribacter marinaquae]|uniref:Glycosyltransferase n=1 Tax=Polaribacter marinaquae TaxID=1642819 RepID=A0ABZ2TT01_9FLAO